MWELDYKESWALKNWCLWSVVLEKTLGSPLDCNEIQPVHSKGDQSWVFFGRNDAKAETPVLWPPLVKSWLIAKDSDAGRHWGQEEKGTNLDSILKSRGVTFPTKIRLVKAMVFQWKCMDVRVGLWRRLSTEELMLLNCGVGEDSWESPGLQWDPTSPF